MDFPHSTGLAGLDRLLEGLFPGDNVVFQVENVNEYRPFVEAFAAETLRRGRRLCYFRFARHEPLLPEQRGVELHVLRPEHGFESFIAGVHDVIAQQGPAGHFVFDCLSDLAADWYSDTMLGNFFTLTCPYLFDIEALAYFALFRNLHSFRATTPITDTAQVVIDIYRHQGHLYLHPIRADRRHSATLFMLHWQDGDELRTAFHSGEVAEILTSRQAVRLESPRYRMGVWRRTFYDAERLWLEQRPTAEQAERRTVLYHQLVRTAITRDERMLGLVERYLTFDDLIAVGQRIIGAGLIGGKAVGMLVARAILRREAPEIAARLEPHDSFYVGSDVFYTFLVRNGLWWSRQKQRDPGWFLEEAARARQRMLVGTFPEYIMEQFGTIIDYFGQSPIIVRSSSLLEDNFGNAFAGQYESVFCSNQGSRERRLKEFLAAIRRVYASSMSERALQYRARRGLLDRDEPMALLVQRVSGVLDGDLFYPHAAGVGFSHNPFVWSSAIDPKAGVLRLVVGLGTRAVERAENDTTRLVALNAPLQQPELRTRRLPSQRRMDVIDLRAGRVATRDFAVVANASRSMPLALLADREDAGEDIAQRRQEDSPWRITFASLLSHTQFPERMRSILATLEKAYGAPVDIEFTVNIAADGEPRINLLQCRPLAIASAGPLAVSPLHIAADDILFRGQGAVIGTSRDLCLDRIVYVVPDAYGALPLADRYEIARAIGRIFRHPDMQRGTTLLMGPGRWGTSTPALGVPVSFGEICRAAVLCEIVAMRDDFTPDVSLGTHFFTELVEWDILYLALFPGRDGNLLNSEALARLPNSLHRLLPADAVWDRALRVVVAESLPGSRRFRLVARSVEQEVICFADMGGSANAEQR